MPNVSEKKKKLLYLAQILLEKTDSSHTLTLPELLQELENLGVAAERKSIYDDIETLRSVGLEIETRKNKTFQYYVEKRLFSTQELRLIAAALDRDPSLSARQTSSLTGKLGKLCSGYEAGSLRHPAAEEAEPEPELQEPLEEKKEEKAGEKLTLEFSSSALEQVEQRFGHDLSPEPAGKNRQRVTVRTEPNAEFFAWLFLQSAEVRMVSPKKLCEQFRERAKAVAKLYKN